MRFQVVAALVAGAGLALPAAAAANPPLYHGQLKIDFRYTSGGALQPGGAADIEQTAHLVLTVKKSRVVHMHGVVGFDYKWEYNLCPTFVVETDGGGTVDGGPDFGNAQLIQPVWRSKTRYGTIQPAIPSTTKVTTQSTTETQSCTSTSTTDRATFELMYVPIITGVAPRNAKTLTGSLVKNLQGTDGCHPFYPLPPPPPVGVSCTWNMHWTFTR
jgi:hypothetical protein